jgi:hypothetical protein
MGGISELGSSSPAPRHKHPKPGVRSTKLEARSPGPGARSPEPGGEEILSWTVLPDATGWLELAVGFSRSLRLAVMRSNGEP